jgi:hypothetical protein
MRDREVKLLEASFPSSPWIVFLLSSSGDADQGTAGDGLSCYVRTYTMGRK